MAQTRGLSAAGLEVEGAGRRQAAAAVTAPAALGRAKPCLPKCPDSTVSLLNAVRRSIALLVRLFRRAEDGARLDACLHSRLVEVQWCMQVCATARGPWEVQLAGECGAVD